MLSINLLYIFLIILFAGFMQTLTGFGYALAAAPLLIFVMNPKDVVIFLLLTGIIMKSVLIYQTRTDGSFASILPLFLASMIGGLPGGYLLTIISDHSLKMFIAIILILSTLLMSLDKAIHIKGSNLTKMITGLLSGFLGSTTSMSGPPIVLYYLNTQKDKDKIRADLARFFVLGNTWSIIVSCFFGTAHLLQLSLSVIVSIPAIFLGFWFGEKIFTKLSGQAFKRIALSVLFSSGLAIIGSEIYKLI